MALAPNPLNIPFTRMARRTVVRHLNTTDANEVFIRGNESDYFVERILGYTLKE